MDFTYRIEETLAVLSESSQHKKLLTRTSWNNQRAKLDLRVWKPDNGKLIPQKGVTLSDLEARLLRDALEKAITEEGKPA